MKRFMVLVLLLVSIMAMGCGKEKFSELSDADKKSHLMDMSRTQICRHLKAPSTAKFPTSTSEYSFKQSTDNKNVFIVMSYVDAQNGFGALIRKNFVIKFEVNEEPADGGGYAYKVLDYAISK